MEVDVVSLSSEFPNDNPALHRGTIWVCLEPTGRPQPEPPAATAPVAAAERGAVEVVETLSIADGAAPAQLLDLELDDVGDLAIVVEELEPVDANIERVADDRGEPSADPPSVGLDVLLAMSVEPPTVDLTEAVVAFADESAFRDVDGEACPVNGSAQQPEELTCEPPVTAIVDEHTQEAIVEAAFDREDLEGSSERGSLEVATAPPIADAEPETALRSAELAEVEVVDPVDEPVALPRGFPPIAVGEVFEAIEPAAVVAYEIVEGGPSLELGHETVALVDAVPVVAPTPLEASPDEGEVEGPIEATPPTVVMNLDDLASTMAANAKEADAIAPAGDEPQVVAESSEPLEGIEAAIEDGVRPTFEAIPEVASVQRDSSALPPAPDDPFTMFVCTLADVAIQAGSPNVASVLPGLLFDGRLPDTLDPDVLEALRAAGLLDGQEIADAFVTTTCAWRAILRGTSDDFDACGAAMLDEWASDLLAKLLNTPANAPTLRHELRSRGVAAFGLAA